MGKRFLAGFELGIFVISVFAFAHLVAADSSFEKLYEEYSENQQKEANAWLEESESRSSFSLSSSDLGLGCCEMTVAAEQCATATQGSCLEGATFAEGVSCESASFCERGCCYDENLGIYDRNVLKINCPKEWVEDPNCNMPAAKLGCCVLGTYTIYETLGQCEVDTNSRALGEDSVVDWRGELNEAQCVFLSSEQKEGACVLGNGNCKFLSQGDCLNMNGQFNEGVLCTAASLGTDCKPTEMTTCVQGKDQVYFVDSCGNYANIYDASKAEEQSYWERVVLPEDSCGTDSDEANANSKTCGNCNRFLGGICASASANDFNPEIGDSYCKPTSCTYEGKDYENGESWCIYDGKIGDGDDVVGSRHWKYVCSQGVIQIEPCADYRNEICIQTEKFDVEENEVEFSNAACVANNWRACINLNSDKEGLAKCEDTLNCRLEKVAIADKFRFDMCVPKYPGGFSFGEERYQKTAESICGMADQTCTVMYKQTLTGKCKIAANEGCLKAGFAQGMNDLCRKLGDCGLEVNVEGEYTENYAVTRSPRIGASWISRLVGMKNPVKGQYAEVEDYSEYLEAAGVLAPEAVNPEEDDELPVDPTMVGAGLAGIGYAVGVYALYTGALTTFGSALSLNGLSVVSQGGLSYLSPGAPSMAGFAGAMIGAGIGMVVGNLVAKQLGLSPMGSILMAVGGAMVGAYVATWIMGSNTILLSNPITFWIGVALIVSSLFFGGKECKPVEVTFECKPWQPPSGGDDCEKCNEDPLKPCSEYRCSSLGAACNLINKGTEDELCIDENPDDVTPPRLAPQLGVISENEIYEDINDKGFVIANVDGGCIDAYTLLKFGINTDEPSQCKFDLEMKEFEEMSFSLGGSSYVYNHTTVFTLPDPSHGQSQGSDWKGDLTFYIQCQDTHGAKSPGYYTVDLCVNEGPDKTPPTVRATEPANNALLGYAETSKEIKIITNELAECRWDVMDKDYSVMSNSMECDADIEAPSSSLGYSCLDNVSLSGASNNYYVRCMDQPWLEEENRSSERNANQQSFLFTLKKPEEGIKIDWIEPSKDFESATKYTTINLEIGTLGGGEFHFCSYSFSGYENMIEMFETGAEKVHEQPLNRPSGRNKIYVECKDETGEVARGETEFRIIHDTSTPQVARVWQSSGEVHLVTTEDAECRYTTTSCKFKWDDGESAGEGRTHEFSAVRGNTYYIKCKDEFENVPSDCSIKIRAL